MKSSIRFVTGIILAISLSGWFSSVYASQSIVPSSGKPQSITSITEYSYKISEPSISLKWPRGSLIFPEINDPNKANEVFLLSKTFSSQSELQSLHHHLGLQFFSRHKYNKAKAEYLKALKFNPKIPSIYKDLGLIYFNFKNYKRAERAYRKALQLEPEYTTALAKLALSLAAQKKYTSAERKFKQAIRAEPSNAEHYLNMGHFYYYLKKNYKGAKNSYRKALKLNPRLKKAKNNLRDINRKFRKWQDQESDFESSWGSDFDYDSSKNKDNSKSTPSYPEEADIAGTWNEENTPNPLF
jgi:tetratricopeptide (TPR) repeat protein